jgi:predicted transcriptional regulator YdeE
MTPEHTRRGEMWVVGIEARTTNAREMAPETAAIPGLWRRFLSEGIRERIPHPKPQGPLLGVYTRYASDHHGAYSLIVGTEVTSLEGVPKDFVGLRIAPADYRVFPARGEMPAALIATWGQIWREFEENVGERRAFTTDFEIHLSPSEVDIWIAVAPGTS